jgi:UDP-N-acetylmuramoyl-tripeptide--D-alanyl-D-alanine ligase
VVSPLWNLQEIRTAIGGRLHGSPPDNFNGVSIDSREISPGDIYFAIKGDRLDGHDFVASALKKGAGVAIVSRLSPDMALAGPVLEVDIDPLQALQSLARAARARSQAQIVAVTGSVGKTSTKEMLRIALSASGKTHVSLKSFNNHWGVPLTLARLAANNAYAVLEIGMNHPGEITPLVGLVRPHVAVVTSIAESHLGQFASLAAIAKAKAEIFSGVVHGGSAVLCRDTPHFESLAAEAARLGISDIKSFGEHQAADVRLEQVALHADCCCITAKVFGERMSYKLGLPGRHMATNSLSVLAVAKLVGADLARAGLALADARPATGRGVRQELQHPEGVVQVLDESYNANPASVRASLALLGQMRPGRGGRRVAVLGDMLELGNFSQDLHKAIANDLAVNAVDVLYAAGPEMKGLWDAVAPAMRGAYSESAMGLWPVLEKSLQPGDCVMVKGSAGIRMGSIVESMRKTWPPRTET